MAEPLSTTTHVKVARYVPRSEGEPALELTTRAETGLQHAVGVAVFGAGAVGALAGTFRLGGPASLALGTFGLVAAAIALLLVRRLYLPQRVRIEDGWLVVGSRRFGTGHVSMVKTWEPPGFPGRHDVLLWMYDEANGSPFDVPPAASLAVQLRESDARAVRTMVLRTLGKPEKDG
jgi:hypothetical protein